MLQCIRIDTLSQRNDEGIAFVKWSQWKCNRLCKMGVCESNQTQGMRSHFSSSFLYLSRSFLTEYCTVLLPILSHIASVSVIEIDTAQIHTPFLLSRRFGAKINFYAKIMALNESKRARAWARALSFWYERNKKRHSHINSLPAFNRFAFLIADDRSASR